MGRQTARLLFFLFIIFAAFTLIAQEAQETDYTFYLRFDDDESDDVPVLPDYWDRPFETVDAVQRYEESEFKFDLVSLGGSRGRTGADTPDALIDVFDILHRSDHPRHGSVSSGKRGSDSADLHCRLNSDFYFHNKERWYSGQWSVISEMFNNDFTLDINTEGYLAIDKFRLDISPSVSFFNSFWSYSDEKERTVADAAGVLWTHHDVRYTFSGYGGFDIIGMTPTAGTFYSVRFAGFDTGGYIGIREGQFDFGTKFAFAHQFFSIAADADFMTDFTSRWTFQPDLMLQFSFSPVTFLIFKQSDTFGSELFLQIADFINTYRYTKDTSSVAGAYFFGDFGRITTECVASFYSLDEDFLSLDERLTFLNPNYFSECIVTSRFRRFSLHFAGYLDGDFTPNIALGTGVGVKEIKVWPVTLGFYADFFTENMFADYRITVRTEIATDISRHFSFYLKSYNEFYLNKPEIDFYIQAGFKSFF